MKPHICAKRPLRTYTRRHRSTPRTSTISEIVSGATPSLIDDGTRSPCPDSDINSHSDEEDTASGHATDNVRQQDDSETPEPATCRSARKTKHSQPGDAAAQDSGSATNPQKAVPRLVAPKHKTKRRPPCNELALVPGGLVDDVSGAAVTPSHCICFPTWKSRSRDATPFCSRLVRRKDAGGMDNHRGTWCSRYCTRAYQSGAPRRFYHHSALPATHAPS